MNSSLIVAFEFSRDGDDFGWLTAEVQTPRFRGSNGMWVQWQDVSELAEALRAYPIKQNDPITADWGFGEALQGKAVATTITGLSIEPRGKTGGLVARICLADYYKPANRCSTQFETDYPSLALFADEITRLLRERSGSATLHGDANVC
ncbi:hypothetical protein [Sphingomonas aquatilis]|uniref:hypothetical protein n=1 Tax=Sphingomonas aquatilis TaxID=93063 RepID=UPI0023FA12D9|nr:hypothetical protein [Sphingomonas aquatilis]MCI4654450.1 hypothetical protein [Sphingomonas aquatilis]